MSEKISYHKKTNYAAQKKYAAAHPEIRRKANQNRAAVSYRAHITIPQECKPVLEAVLQETGLTLNQLFVSAVEEKYGVILHKEK